ncbi:IS21 family transposase [Glaciihabitans sp. GrIS 2.15]|uniref:IS21 family transposase n=1 Tax=Glaciihabitans sp. GrIS 2.15 TaxID=3071710 RepID=UPI002E149292
MITVENWAEIRRLHRSENIPIKEISRLLGVARNTVRAALASDRPPKYERGSRGSLVDAVEIDVRKLLVQFPRMPATVIAERIGWEYLITTLKDRIRQIRPEYAGVDPADRITYLPGEIMQYDLWFPEPRIPVGHAQLLMLPVLVMTLGFSRFQSARMIPSRQAGDLLAGMWSVLSRLGAVPKTLIWDRESAIGGTGRVSVPAAGFAGTLGTRIQLAPARDPEFKGLVERNNGFLETSFLPGRSFTSPTDFNTQLDGWLLRANSRLIRSTGQRPVDALAGDRAAMGALPPVEPVMGLRTRVRLARDYYVRIDSVDYSVDPRAIGRFIDVHATESQVIMTCNGDPVGSHVRCWAKRVTITDPAHVAVAKTLRAGFAADKLARERASRHHADGHRVTLRALTDYDTLFGSDFTTTSSSTTTQKATS